MLSEVRSPTKTILVIEDDLRIQKALGRQFGSEGYDVQLVSNGLEAVATCHATKPVAVVLDLMLPGMSGREICRQIKSESPNLPVIILSAISEVVDKVLLLELGADDYVTKPFSPRELLARVQAAVRRSERFAEARLGAVLVASTNSHREFGEVTTDLLKMEVYRAGVPVTLTAHEFKLLKHFLNNVDRVLTRDELLQDVWGYNFPPTTRIVDNQVLKLRQKLERDPAKPVHFRTVHGTGYKFVVQP